MIGVHDTDSYCPECGTEILGALKETSSGWKVYAECTECGRDYGRVGFVKLSDVDHQDEKFEQAASKINNINFNKL